MGLAPALEALAPALEAICMMPLDYIVMNAPFLKRFVMRLSGLMKPV